MTSPDKRRNCTDVTFAEALVYTLRLNVRQLNRRYLSDVRPCELKKNTTLMGSVDAFALATPSGLKFSAYGTTNSIQDSPRRKESSDGLCVLIHLRL